MNKRCNRRSCAEAVALVLSVTLPVCGFAADWAWTSTTVPAVTKSGHGERNWGDQANWGDGASGAPDIVSDAALADSYSFGQSIARSQWVLLPTPSAEAAFAGYLGTLSGGFHNSIVLSSPNRLSNRLYVIANPNGFLGDWFISGDADGKAVASGFLLPATPSFTPVLQRVRLSGGMQFKVATGGAAELGYPFGEGAFSVNKKIKGIDETTGTLSIKRSPGPRSELRVYGGKVVLTGRGYTDADMLVPGAALHLDASKGDSLKEDVDGVSRWNDADGGVHYAIPVTNSGKPRVIPNRVNGRSVVNFGAQKYPGGVYGDPAVLGEPSRLVLDSALEGVREFFVVFEDSSDKCIGPCIVNNDTYARVEKQGCLFGDSDMSEDKSRFAAVETADISLDGQAVEHTLPAYGFAGRMHVVAVGHRGDFTGLLSSIAAPATDGEKCGGVHIAEIVAYTKSLTPDQRRQNVAYLRRKWQAEGDADDLDYGTVLVAADAEIEVSDGTSVEVGQLKVANGVAKLVKTGGGMLLIDNYLTPDVEVEVRGGSVKFGSPLNLAEPAQARDPLVWLDANTLTGGSVTEWADARGPAKANILASRDDDTYPAASLDTTTVVGMKMVDMGSEFSKEGDSTYLIIKDNGAAIGKSVRCGFMVYCKSVGRAVVPSSSGNTLRVVDGTREFIDSDWGNAHAVGGVWTLDGNPIDPTSCGEMEGNTVGDVHVVSFRFPSAMPVNMLGADRDAETSKSNNNRGGIKFGEVLLYDRVLSDSEWKATESYLLAKWKGVQHPADVAAKHPLKLSYSGEADNVIDVESDRELQCVTLNGTKPVIKRGKGAVVVPRAFSSRVANYAVENGSLLGKVGSDELSALLSKAYFHADAMAQDSLETTKIGEVERVDAWKSASGQTISATPFETKQTEQRPILAEVIINGMNRKAVDFGSFASKSSDLQTGGSSYSLTIGSRGAPLAELHYIARDADSKDHTASSTRTAIVGATGGTGISKNEYPIFRGGTGGTVLADKSYAAAFALGSTWLNGENVDAATTTPDFQKFYQVTMVPTNALSATWTLARRTKNEIGGLQIGEVVMYSETNSDADRALIDAYLEKKWFGTGSGCIWTVENLAAKAGTTINLATVLGVTAQAGSLSGAGTIAAGDITAAEVALGDDATAAGVLTVSGNLTMQNGAVIRVDLNRALCDMLLVDGKLVLAGSGTVSVGRLLSGRCPSGDYVIASASAGIACDDLSAWTVTSTSDINGLLRIVDGTKLVLSVKNRGLMLILR